jgi:hypothetical protein
VSNGKRAKSRHADRRRTLAALWMANALTLREQRPFTHPRLIGMHVVLVPPSGREV